MPFSPNNPHPLSQLKTKLVWQGKYDASCHRIAPLLGIPVNSSTDSGHAVQRWREATLVVEIINQLDGMVMTERTFR